MPIKSSLLSYVFGCAKALSEHAPSMAHAAGAAGEGVGLIYPAAILTAAISEGVAEYVKDRKKPDDFADLYRESLLHAIQVCTNDFQHLTDEDRGIVELWKEGLDVRVKDDPLWKSILEDSIPTRMLSIDPTNSSSYWPLLRAQLEQWTNWFRYRRNAGTAPQGFNIPRQPLVLSQDFDRYLAANLPRELLDRFQPELGSGHHRDAFNQTLLRILNDLNQQLRPLDPVRHIGEFPKPEQASTAIKMLDARYRVAPYIGRRGDLDSLWNWLQSPAPVSCQVVVGRGGIGKTRLAYQFLEEIENREPFRWHAGLLEYQRFKDELANDKFRRWRGRKPTLIVIDYADAAAPLLEQYIIPELAQSGLGLEDAPIRFLLLARTADESQGWYKTLRRAAGTSEEDLFPNPPLVLRDLDPAQRRELVQAMLTAASRVEGGKRLILPLDGQDALIDERILSPDFVDPLVLSMAAIVANGQQSLSALHLHRTDLARGMAKRERKRLENLARTGDKALLLHVAAYVNLAGSMRFEELERAIRTEKSHLDSKETTGFVAGILAPNGVAEPIALDIIAEAFVYDILRENVQHGPETVLRAAARRPGPVTRTLVRTVQDFEPDHAGQGIDDEQCQGWALTQLTGVLKEHSQAISDDVFWEIHAALPHDTVAMILPARDFYLAICKLRNPSTSLVGLSALSSYAIYESKAANRAEALVAIQEAVEIRRELAGTNREAFLPDLAMSLNNQANIQGEMGQRAQALLSIQEAVEIRRELVGKNREAFLPDLAMSLNTQANRQSEMGQRAQALLSIEQAVETFRELVEKNLEGFLPNLAATRNNQASFQSAMGQRAQGLLSIEEAVEIRRELVGKNREAFLPDLGGSLNNQANCQSEMGQRAQGLLSIEEAVEIRRELVGKNREAFLPDLAMSLNNQANLLSEMGQRAQGLLSIEEAVENYRELVGKNREAFLPDLAMALSTQAIRQSEMGQRAQSLMSIEEAVEIYRELVGKNREAFLPDLAVALNNQATIQSEMGQRAPALLSIQEAVENYRELVGKNREAFLPDLAAALNNQANRQSEMGQRADALLSIQEAVENYRELVGKNREAFLRDLAMSLNNQANRQSEMGQRAEARLSIQEAVEIYRELVGKNREAFLPDLALIHGAWGRVMLADEKPAEAAKIFGEGVRLITPLAQQLPEAYFKLALKLAKDYRQAAVAAGEDLDPDYTWPLDVPE
jgi:hypothetical protein